MQYNKGYERDEQVYKGFAILIFQTQDYYVCEIKENNEFIAGWSHLDSRCESEWIAYNFIDSLVHAAVA